MIWLTYAFRLCHGIIRPNYSYGGLSIIYSWLARCRSTIIGDMSSGLNADTRSFSIDSKGLLFKLHTASTYVPGFGHFRTSKCSRLRRSEHCRQFVLRRDYQHQQNNHYCDCVYKSGVPYKYLPLSPTAHENVRQAIRLRKLLVGPWSPCSSGQKGGSIYFRHGSLL